MKLKRLTGITLPVLAILFVTNLNAQQVKTGDQCPEDVLPIVLNYPVPDLRLSDFRGKIVILEFWNTWCSSCIEAFPKLDSLQKIFSRDMQIVLVTNESADKIVGFFKKHSNVIRPDIPMIVNDKKLNEAFPSEGRPYVVWINKQGIVENFSSGTNVSKQNLLYFIAGKKMLFRDPTLERSGSAIQENNFESISFISHCYETLNIGNNEIQEDSTGQSVSIRSNCSSIVDLFIKAFSEFGKNNFKTRYGLQLCLSDSFKYQYPKNLEFMDHWLNENAYNYQLVLPKVKADQAYKMMQQDLVRYFDLNASINKLLVNGLVLVNRTHGRLKEEKAITVKSKRILTYATLHPDSVYIFKNEPMVKFSKWLKTKLFYFFPVIDSTNYSGNISVIIRKSSLKPFNFQQFREDLNLSGFECLNKEIETAVLLIEGDN